AYGGSHHAGLAKTVVAATGGIGRGLPHDDVVDQRDVDGLRGLPLVDHVIVGQAASDPAGRGYYSFREAGMV
ncbi:MAG: hypothetical protein ACKOTE_05945, partial [Opitutaceae bacterium]